MNLLQTAFVPEGTDEGVAIGRSSDLFHTSAAFPAHTSEASGLCDRRCKNTQQRVLYGIHTRFPIEARRPPITDCKITRFRSFVKEVRFQLINTEINKTPKHRQLSGNTDGSLGQNISLPQNRAGRHSITQCRPA